MKPDIAVTQQRPISRRAPQGSAATLDLEPVVVAVPAVEEVVERWIEVRHREDNALITAIEILSPTNKTSDGFGEYLAKRQSLLRQRVNLVELDLLVGGKRPKRAKGQPAGDYFAIVSRAEEPTRREVFAWSVRRNLPNVPIPLRASTPTCSLS